MKYLLDLAQVHRRYGHAEEALPLLNKALELEKDPRLRVGILQMAGETALSNPKHAPEAAGYFQQAIQQTPDKNQKLALCLWLGGAYRTAKQYAKAEAAFWRAYKGFKDARQKQDALRQCLGIVRRKDRIDAAIAEYEKRAADNPKDLDALTILSLIYSRPPRKNPQKALPIQEKICAARPDDLNELKKLASLYEQTGQAAQAVAIYRKVVAKKPDEVEKLARALIRAGKKEAAAQAVRKFLEGKADDVKTLERAAGLFEQIGMAQEGLALREKAVGLMKDEHARSEARFRLADRYRLMKSYKKAEELLRGLLKEAREAKPKAAAGPKAAAAFAKTHRKAVGRAKKALIQLYEAQGRLDELDF